MSAQNTRFASVVHVLALLAHVGSPLSSESIAASLGSNATHVRSLLAPLRRLGVVTSRPGSGGGWDLLQPPGSITMAQVWRAVYDDTSPLVHPHDDPSHTCPIGVGIHGSLDGIRSLVDTAVLDALEGVTLADVVERTIAPVDDRIARAPARRQRR